MKPVRDLLPTNWQGEVLAQVKDDCADELAALLLLKRKYVRMMRIEGNTGYVSPNSIAHVILFSECIRLLKKGREW